MKRFSLVVLLLVALASSALAVESISGAAFTVEVPLPSGCTAGAKSAGAQGYAVLALGDGECGCVTTYFSDLSAIAWKVTPNISVDTLQATNDDGCIEATVAVYVAEANLTTLGTPTATVIEDDDISATANVAHYMGGGPSGTIAVYNVTANAACAKPTCDNKLARLCLKRVITGICSTNDYTGDIRIEQLVVDKNPP